MRPLPARVRRVRLQTPEVVEAHRRSKEWAEEHPFLSRFPRARLLSSPQTATVTVRGSGGAVDAVALLDTGSDPDGSISQRLADRAGAVRLGVRRIVGTDGREVEKEFVAAEISRHPFLPGPLSTRVELFIHDPGETYDLILGWPVLERLRLLIR